MPRVLLSASFPAELIVRQTPGRTGHWEEFEFLTEANGPVDAWVVYDNLGECAEHTCPASNTLLITGEPESLRRYRKRFTGQFAHVWTSHKSISHSRLVRRNEAQPWHYALRPGRVHGCQLGFDEIKNIARPTKTKLMSVICSSKDHTPDHRQRLEFVKMLQAHFGDAIDVFGRGIRDMQDKSEAIYDYKYHIVLENDHSDHFMTEKLGDAYLGWSYPIYFGGPEAYHRFPEGSFTAIDIYKPEHALIIIQNILASDMYEQSVETIQRARDRVLYKNNICNLLAEFWRFHLVRERASKVKLIPKQCRTSLVLNQLGRALRRPFRNAASNGFKPRRAA